MSAIILFLTVMLLGGLWVWAVRESASRQAPAEAGRWTSRAAILFAALVLIESALGASGLVSRFDDLPPPFALNLVFIVAVASFIAFSRFGTLIISRIPFPGLIGFQAFRILAEFVIYFGVRQGIAPVQMSFEGYQFDIVTGMTALPVAWWVARNENLALIRAWNWMGMAFLLVIAFIAATSMPAPVRLFMNEPSNAWVTTFPYILLPGVLVTAAIAGHLLCFRKLALVKKRS